MWPVFIEKFNCEFLKNDARGEVQLIILFLHFYWAVFLSALKSYKLRLLGKIQTLLMWPVFIEKFNCELLRNDAGGEVQLIILFLHFYWAVLGVLKCVEKI